MSKKNIDAEQLKRAMAILYDEARREREQLRKDFVSKEYEWYVSGDVFDRLQQIVSNYNILDINAMYVFDIRVTCCPVLDGIELVHRIGGVEL